MKQQEEGVLTLSNTQRKVEIKCTLLKMLEEEELYLFKRSHGNWLLKGDNNTEFFHRVANARRTKKILLSL